MIWTLSGNAAGDGMMVGMTGLGEKDVGLGTGVFMSVRGVDVGVIGSDVSVRIFCGRGACKEICERQMKPAAKRINRRLIPNKENKIKR
jgi:hypothetical protein